MGFIIVALVHYLLAVLACLDFYFDGRDGVIPLVLIIMFGIWWTIGAVGYKLVKNLKNDNT